MKSYTIYEPPGSAAGTIEKAEKLQFVREGFSWIALFLPVPWMIWNRTWLSLLIYIVVVFAFQLVAALIGSGEETAAIIGLLLNIAMGFEANNLRRWEFEQQGYQLVGTVSGSSIEECELKFFDNWLEQEKSANDLTKLAVKSMANKPLTYPGGGI